MLERILGPAGGINDPRDVPALLAALGAERRDAMRHVLLVVVERSTPESKSTMIATDRLIKSLESWVVEQQQQQQPGGDDGDGTEEGEVTGGVALILAVLRCLASLPMDLPTLKRTGVGKTVGSLRKHADETVAEAARALVEKWRTLAGGGGLKSASSAEEGSSATALPLPKDGKTQAAGGKAPAPKKPRTALQVGVDIDITPYKLLSQLLIQPT